jgi:hypothetical protein
VLHLVGQHLEKLDRLLVAMVQHLDLMMLLMLTSQTANRLCRDRLENLQVEISAEKAAPLFTG